MRPRVSSNSSGPAIGPQAVPARRRQGRLRPEALPQIRSLLAATKRCKLEEALQCEPAPPLSLAPAGCQACLPCRRRSCRAVPGPQAALCVGPNGLCAGSRFNPCRAGPPYARTTLWTHLRKPCTPQLGTSDDRTRARTRFLPACPPRIRRRKRLRVCGACAWGLFGTSG